MDDKARNKPASASDSVPDRFFLLSADESGDRSRRQQAGRKAKIRAARTGPGQIVPATLPIPSITTCTMPGL